MMINKKLTLILMFLVAVGLCSGSFFETYMHGTGKEQLMENLSLFFTAENNEFLPSFLSSLKSWLKIWLFMLLCPIVPPLALACPLICLIKGLTLGFSATMLVETFGLKGSFYIFTTVVPHNLLQLPLLCVMASLAMQLAFEFFKLLLQKISKNCNRYRRVRRTPGRSANKNALQNSARHYVIIYLIVLAAISITCALEAFLMQSLL